MRYEKPEMDIVEFVENVYMELSKDNSEMEDDWSNGSTDNGAM